MEVARRSETGPGRFRARGPRVIGWALAANTLTTVLAQLFVIGFLQDRSRTLALAEVGVLLAAA
ncbi:MAG TPA: hypothetical protein VFM54_06345 [Micromonosporaceae bacterium]|nr:hypothetical protein [Micromonosporaceae bacterium]